MSMSANTRDLDEKLHKCTLLPADKQNIDLAVDYIVLDAILKGMPWDSDNVEPTYLMRASTETGNGLFYIHFLL